MISFSQNINQRFVKIAYKLIYLIVGLFPEFLSNKKILGIKHGTTKCLENRAFPVIYNVKIC